MDINNQLQDMQIKLAIANQKHEIQIRTVKYATAVLQGMAASNAIAHSNHENTAKLCFDIADAMLKKEQELFNETGS